MDPTKKLRISDRKYKIKTDLGGVFALFADPTDTCRFAIGSLFNFFFLLDKKNKKGFSDNYVLK